MEKQELPALQSCPECGVQVRNLAKHQKKAHDPVKISERKRAEALEIVKVVAERNRLSVERARKLFLATKVQCSTCRQSVELHLIPDHFFKVHNSPIPADMRAIYGLAEPKNLFKSEREREEYWRSASGMPPKGEDIFDRNLVTNGGAYGLGKNRKH
ncbi:hypothetical protein N0K08_17530 [Acidovorax sp. Be4]|uniref:C2H2-type domain-containing protein n=1 Tax=Acidovorax bellezanensis TaxID=2976702 RepID=A0ABT2PQE6_9BURK|nr:hypothetical protein [Acidovorax sp. Be4]MCT9812448.1 hypothetical protein [Acidovorax sp. Be4]